jgi:hypothetical protein
LTRNALIADILVERADPRLTAKCLCSGNSLGNGGAFAVDLALFFPRPPLFAHISDCQFTISNFFFPIKSILYSPSLSAAPKSSGIGVTEEEIIHVSSANRRTEIEIHRPSHP